MTFGWTWEKGTPRERAEMVRGTVPHCLGNKQKLRELFNLTEDGLSCILGGYDWRPEYTDGANAERGKDG